MMKTIRSIYYKDFHCIADKCSFTCCQEWQIGVDYAIKEKWKKLDSPLFEDTKKLSDYVGYQGFCGDSIELNQDGKCPFLKENQLCQVVLIYGEECLSMTCHTFPREGHEYGNLLEQGLSLECPEVIDLLWKQECFDLEINKESKEENGETRHPVFEDVNPLFQAIRELILEILSNEKLPVTVAFKMAFYIMLALNEKKMTLEECRDSLFLIELETAVKETEEDKRIDLWNQFYEHNELFLDIVDSYRKKNIYQNTYNH